MPRTDMYPYELGYYWRVGDRLYATFWMPPATLERNVLKKSTQVHIDTTTRKWYYSWRVRGWTKGS